MAVDAVTGGWRKAGRYLILLAVAVIILLPIYVLLVAALKPGNEVLKRPFVPTNLTLQTLRDAWTDGHLGRYLFNSAVMALIVTVAQLTTSVLSA